MLADERRATPYDVTVAGATLNVTFTSATVAGGGTLNGKLTWNGKLTADTTVHFGSSDAVTVPTPGTASDLVVKAGTTLKAGGAVLDVGTYSRPFAVDWNNDHCPDLVILTG